MAGASREKVPRVPGNVPEIKYGGYMGFYDLRHNVLVIQGRYSDRTGWHCRSVPSGSAIVVRVPVDESGGTRIDGAPYGRQVWELMAGRTNVSQWKAYHEPQKNAGKPVAPYAVNPFCVLK